MIFDMTAGAGEPYKVPVLSSAYPADAAVDFGTDVVCKVEIASHGNPEQYTYRWYKNGNFAEESQNSFFIFTPDSVGTVTVKCDVMNAAGTVTSRTATITVSPLYLYRNADVCADVTGGWRTTNQCTLNTASTNPAPTHMLVDTNSGQAGSAATRNKIDLTKFNTLVFRGFASRHKDNNLLYVGNADASGFNYIIHNAAKTNIPTGDQNSLVRLDISGISGQYHVGCGASDYAAVRCYEMYLE